MGRYWEGVCLGAVIIGCVVYGIQLGWGAWFCGLVCFTSSGFSSGLLFSAGPKNPHHHTFPTTIVVVS